MNSNTLEKTPNEKKKSKLVTNCYICKGEFDVIEFKNHCICEECVVYIKSNY